MPAADFIHPQWDAPNRVRALITTRSGGVSSAPYASFNLGSHVGDAPEAVARNRALLRQHIPADPCWLNQVHGVAVADADSSTGVPDADAAIARQSGRVCAVLTADCLPVLLCDRAGTVVAAAHAGWRGLAEGVVEAAVGAMEVEPGSVLAYLGPAIGPSVFEVGDEVRAVFVGQDAQAGACFVPHRPGKWWADLYALARRRLAAIGVNQVWGGDFCTCTDAARFYSYRRDGVTGRMASLIWLD